jgi:hypothetical protein
MVCNNKKVFMVKYFTMMLLTSIIYFGGKKMSYTHKDWENEKSVRKYKAGKLEGERLRTPKEDNEDYMKGWRAGVELSLNKAKQLLEY